VLTEAPMRFTGTTNEYEADVQMPPESAATLRVVVADADRVNFGVAEREI